MHATHQSVFIPKIGQVDFTNVRWCPVLNCVVKHGDRILLVQRSEKLNFYPGYWNGISGFLDDQRSLEEKVRDELREEVGIAADQIQGIHLGQIFDQETPELGKTWIVHPVLVEVSTDAIRLDWEAQQYEWARPEDAGQRQLLPGFEQVLAALGLAQNS